MRRPLAPWLICVQRRSGGSSLLCVRNRLPTVTIASRATVLQLRANLRNLNQKNTGYTTFILKAGFARDPASRLGTYVTRDRAAAAAPGPGTVSETHTSSRRGVSRPVPGATAEKI